MSPGRIQESGVSHQYTLPFDPAAGFIVQVLGSSSAGNCTLIRGTRHAVLVDCGFNPRYIARGLRAHGLEMADLSGVLITHTHGDHLNDEAVNALTGAGVPIFCPAPIRGPLTRQYHAGAVAMRNGMLRTLGAGDHMIGSLGVETFEVPHDSPGGCFGYSLVEGASRVTLATDVGFPQERLVSHFIGSQTIVIESNHDPDMLERSGRPEWLKRRIRERGHLSNDQCAELLTAVLRRSTVLPEAVVLAHISQECNTNPLAVRTANNALGRESAPGVRIVESFKDRPSQVVGVAL
ncbi:MAG: yycJ [Bacteroidetes bacterium]|nr:yycJ [Bacteroidota bacterium]